MDWNFAPRFYPIVETLDDLTSLARRGYIWLQWRNKSTSPEDKKEITTRFRKQRISPHQKLILNDSISEAVTYGFDGVHLGQGDLAAQRDAVERAKKHGLTIGLSTHNEMEIREAIPLGPDYVAIGPIFRSITKPELEPSPLHERQSQVNLIHKLSPHTATVAIGGIRTENMGKVFAMGFSTVAFASLAKELTDRIDSPQDLWRQMLPQNQPLSPA